MEWTNRDMLKRIAALLFALAELADRASLASPSARAQLLAILRYAEAVGYAYVIGMAHDLGAAMPPQAELDDDDADDTRRLGFRLRILALMLANLVAWVERSVGHGSDRFAATITRRSFSPCGRRWPSRSTAARPP